jgi:hypothetical protein
MAISPQPNTIGGDYTSSSGTFHRPVAEGKESGLPVRVDLRGEELPFSRLALAHE